MTEVEWNRLRAEELRALAARDAVVLLPVASTEQHGPHLATGTDTFLCRAVCVRAATLAAEPPIVVAPTVWMGLAEHHVALGGTFTLGLATWHALLRDLCTSVGRAGFRRILLVNGHAATSAPSTRSRSTSRARRACRSRRPTISPSRTPRSGTCWRTRPACSMPARPRPP